MLAISLLLFFILPVLTRSFHSHSQSSQNSSTPSGWNTTTSLTSSERQSLAKDAAARLLPAIDPLTGRIDSLSFSSQDVNLAAVLALQDYYSGTYLYEETLGNMFSAYFSSHNDSFMSSLPQWGLSAFYAYRAYSNETFYTIAKESWERVSAFILGAENTRGVRADSSCPSSRVHLGEQPNIGAVFMYHDNDSDATVNSQTMGPFMTLGAYLYESDSSNTQYLVFANLTGNYLHRHLYNGAIMLDTSNIATCGLDNTTFLTYNTGYTLEGIAVLANQSSRADDGLQMYSDWLNDMVPAAINFVDWTGSDGIISEENADPDDWQSGLKAILVRGLLEARSRNPNATWASLVDDFITVQFNALLDAGSNNTYSTNWHTVSSGALDYPGSIAAMDVLNAAIVTRSSDGPSFASFRSHDGSHDGRRRGTTIVVVAVVVSGVVVLALIGAAIILVRRRNRHAASLREMQEFDIEQPSSTPIEPFVLVKQPASQVVTPVNEKGALQQHGCSSSDPYVMVHSYRAPTGSTPHSSDAGTSTSAGSPDSMVALRQEISTEQALAVPPGIPRTERDAYEGAPPPGYQDATA